MADLSQWAEARASELHDLCRLRGRADYFTGYALGTFAWTASRSAPFSVEDMATGYFFGLTSCRDDSRAYAAGQDVWRTYTVSPVHRAKASSAGTL